MVDRAAAKSILRLMTRDGRAIETSSLPQTDNRAAQDVETIFRMERVRLIAGLAKHVGDISLAEELAQDALVAALATWP
ncbi:MAG: hypothetical protein ACK4Z3_05430, partial [Rhizobium rosettiformans]